MAGRDKLTHIEHKRVLDVVTEKYGSVTAETVVTAARNAADLFDAELAAKVRSHFEWDDSKAGEKHRLAQARSFIVIYVDRPVKVAPRKKVIMTAPASVAVPANGHARKYVASTSEDGRRQLLGDSLSSSYGLDQWLNRYRAALHEGGAGEVAMAVEAAREVLAKLLQPVAEDAKAS